MALTLGLAALALLGVLGLRVHGDGVAAPSCDVASVWDLAYLLGQPVPDTARQDVLADFTAPEISLLDVRNAAGRVGLGLVGVRATFTDLVASDHCPAIIHLTDPDHFVVLVRLSDEWAQVLDRGGPVAYERPALEARYTGHALIREGPGPTGPGPRLELPTFASEFDVTGPGQEIAREFTCRNRGDRDLVLETRVPGG